VSWTCFISVVVLSHGTQATSPGLVVLQQLLLFLGTFTPSLVALWLTAQAGIPGQTQNLLGKIVKWKLNIKWYLFAGGFMVVIKLFVAVLYKIIIGIWPKFGQEAWYIMLIAIIFSTWVQAGEEIGWRGFALPHMSERSGLPISTLLLGVIWACWHLPLFFVKGADTFGQSFPLFLIQVTGLSVALGWLYWRTHGSLLLTMLMHAAVNNTKDIVPSATPGATNVFGLSHSLVAWLTVILLWIFAIYCLIRMRSVKLLE
jgi:membrane protease YdiL (CAAX protease family)